MELATFGKLFGYFIATIVAGMLPAKNAFFAPADLAYEPALVGDFAQRSYRTLDSDTVSIEKDGPDAYRLTLYGRGDMTEFGARLFRLKVSGARKPVYYFLDLTPRRRTTHKIAAGAEHLALMIELEGETLSLWPYDADLPAKGSPVLPGTTDALRRFLRRAVLRDEFSGRVRLSRR